MKIYMTTISFIAVIAVYSSPSYGSRTLPLEVNNAKNTEKANQTTPHKKRKNSITRFFTCLRPSKTSEELIPTEANSLSTSSTGWSSSGTGPVTEDKDITEGGLAPSSSLPVLEKDESKGSGITPAASSTENQFNAGAAPCDNPLYKSTPDSALVPADREVQTLRIVNSPRSNSQLLDALGEQQ